LPGDFEKITKADYSNSGFDRGHICTDRTDTRKNNDATFNMTNILPQAPDNNQGPWVNLRISSVNKQSKEMSFTSLRVLLTLAGLEFDFRLP
jgi:endonuclease G, mitochondrial